MIIITEKYLTYSKISCCISYCKSNVYKKTFFFRNSAFGIFPMCHKEHIPHKFSIPSSSRKVVFAFSACCLAGDSYKTNIMQAVAIRTDKVFITRLCMITVRERRRAVVEYHHVETHRDTLSRAASSDTVAPRRSPLGDVHRQKRTRRGTRAARRETGALFLHGR